MTTDIDADTKTLDPGEIQRLTQVLNSSFDVRALLFFMILDEDGDQYVTKDELGHFFKKYLRNMNTFDNNRVLEVIPVLLQKFRFDQVRQLIGASAYANSHPYSMNISSRIRASITRSSTSRSLMTQPY